MRTASRILPVIFLPALLAGCFSIGGGDGAPNPPTFTGMSALKPSATTKVGGIAAEYGVDRSGGAVVAADPVHRAERATVDLTTDADGKIVNVRVNGPDTVSDWNTSQYVPGGPDVIMSASNGSSSVHMSPKDAFEYQAFGAWQTGRGAAEGTFGAFSVGSVTPVTALAEATDEPMTFKGYSVGSYVDASGREFVTSAEATLTANLANRVVGFETAHTTVRNLGTNVQSAATGLDLDGTMTWAGGSTEMSGSVASANGMTGRLDGRLYGPAAEEIGGTFGLSGSGPETYVGGFGAAKVQ